MDQGFGTDPGDLPSQAQHFGSLSIDHGAREVTMETYGPSDSILDRHRYHLCVGWVRRPVARRNTPLPGGRRAGRGSRAR
jgi:hypothetical protein